MSCWLKQLLKPLFAYVNRHYRIHGEIFLQNRIIAGVYHLILISPMCSQERSVHAFTFLSQYYYIHRQQISSTHISTFTSFWIICFDFLRPETRWLKVMMSSLLQLLLWLPLAKLSMLYTIDLFFVKLRSGHV